MRIVVTSESLRPALMWLQRLLFAASVAMLGYCALVLTDAWLFQQRTNQEFEHLLRGKEPAAAPGTIAADGLIGRLEIPRLQLSAVVLEGLSNKTLRRAVGHIPGMALPGEAGNVGVAGHRDTFFRPLKDIQPHDIITITTPAGEYRYRVVSTRIVSPYEVSVLDATAAEVLTLVTCYPFYFVGSAPDRFIVRAEREL